MNALFEALRNVCLLFLAIVAILLVVRFIMAGIRVIDEGQTAVIERLGRFARVAGPGPVWVMPNWERVGHLIQTRMVGEVYRFSDVWFHGFLPVTIELALSYRLNPSRFPYEKQRELAYYDHAEWDSLTKAHITRVLQDLVPTFEFAHLIGEDGRYRREFEMALASKLNETLATYGMFLNEDNGVALKAVLLPDGLCDSLINITRIDIDARTRGAVIENLMRKYPGLSEGFIISAAGMITGQQLGTGPMMSTFLFGGANDARLTAPQRFNQEQPPQKSLEGADSNIWRVLKSPPDEQEK